MPAEFSTAPLAGLILIHPRRFSDERGAFWETYKRSEYVAAGLTAEFVQDNHSVSTRGTLRGLHFQRDPHAQGKLVRVVAGRVWDVAVDLREGSPTRGQWHGIEISSENGVQFYLPPGFAHGFLALTEGAEVVYKCTAEYHRESESGIRWDDPAIGIDWPRLDVPYVISERDRGLGNFS